MDFLNNYFINVCHVPLHNDLNVNKINENIDVVSLCPTKIFTVSPISTVLVHEALFKLMVKNK